MRRLILFVALAVSAQVRQPDPAAIERVANEELKATHTPGAAVAIVSGDRVVFSHGYGVSSVETGAPVSPDMLFRLGSTTKMFTAAALAGLDVNLDAPVGTYISGLDPVIAKLTANQLLSHTSGLRDEAPMFGSHDEAALGTGIHAWKADYLFAPPGRIYSYSNPGYWLAGFLAETIAGKPYADVVANRIFQPMGMNRSTLRPTVAMTWPLAQGHETSEEGKPEVIRPAADNAASWPAGSIFSSAPELARFVIAFLNGGKLDGKPVLSPKVIAVMSSPHAKIPGSDAEYGYGLQMSSKRGVQWVEHGGSRAGYGSTIRMAPDRKFAVIIVANRTGSAMPKLADAISEQMLALEPEVKNEPPTHALTAAEARRYEGVYRNGATSISLKAEGNMLQEGSRKKVPYTRASDGVLLGEPPAKLVVVPDANGRPEYLFTGGRAYRRSD